MMEYTAFIIASVALTLMPGPDILYVITESITRGKRYGITIALGLVSGLIFHTALVATGVGLFIQQTDWLYQVIKLAGVAYLCYLAYLATKEEKSPPQDAIQIETQSEYNFGSLYRRGITMNVLNPKVTIFFLAFLPGFVNQEADNPILQICILGLIFMTQAIVIFISVSYLADQLGQLLKLKRFWSILYWFRIGVLLGISVLLLLT